jgi:hypothetical protein
MKTVQLNPTPNPQPPYQSQVTPLVHSVWYLQRARKSRHQSFQHFLMFGVSSRSSWLPPRRSRRTLDIGLKLHSCLGLKAKIRTFLGFRVELPALGAFFGLRVKLRALFGLRVKLRALFGLRVKLRTFLALRVWSYSEIVHYLVLESNFAHSLALEFDLAMKFVHYVNSCESVGLSVTPHVSCCL